MSHSGVVALRRVVLQQMSKHFGACKVVDSYDFVAGCSEHLTESKTSDTTESVDCNSYVFLCHCEFTSEK